MAEVELGKIESSDEMNDRVYKFQIVHDDARNRVTVKASPVTGTYVDKNNVRNILKKIDDDKGYALWGAPYSKAGADDPREVEYRVHFDKDDVATDLEVYVVTLNRRGEAKDPQSLKVKLPALG